jgi:polysaccharide export outer membrane protein
MYRQIEFKQNQFAGLNTMRRITFAIFVILVMGLATFASDKKAETKVAASTPAVAPSDPDYVIGVEDVLSITVWREADLSRTAPVRPDGKISFPLIGQLQAAGQTPLQLQQKLTASLDSYIASPEVSVIVQDARSQRVNVVGEVNRPGIYPLSKPMTVLDALAGAGGLRDFAKPNKIFILRTNPDGTRQRIRFNYRNVLHGMNGPDQNTELQPRDTVVVP